MGKRSRRQQQRPAGSTGKSGGGPKSEPPAKPARRFAAAERSIKQRPPAPWDPFPLAELGIFIGLVTMVVGWLFTSGDLNRALLAAGFTLAALGGMDTIFREHFNGYRSHAGVIAGMLLVATLILATALLEIGIAPRAAIAIVVFGLAFTALRRDFIRRSGGKRVL